MILLYILFALLLALLYSAGKEAEKHIPCMKCGVPISRHPDNCSW